MSTTTRLEPQPPDLQPPWRTAARVELQIEARTFAQDIVLPIADELDPHKAEMPRSLIDQMAAKGWFGITIPAECGGMGLGVFEYCLVSEELARAWLSVGSILARGQGLGTQTIDDAARPKANGSGPSRYLNPPQARTSRPFKPEPPAKMATGFSLEPSDGRALRSPQTSLRCSPGHASPSKVSRALPGFKHSWWSNSQARFLKA
jgi:Acyl-CoA dehydrogenase, N-terminal domain